ncbi:MAG: lytic transglycosylase domain-containing protein [Limnohabitans sp.]|jgi:soluble lytic murein transglycosylase-like protein|nr:lytic transglycosylase domain-containing protein [Limnohabitans sp.]
MFNNGAQDKTWLARCRSVLAKFVLVTHRGLAVLGLLVAVLFGLLWLQPQWLQPSEQRLAAWLRERKVLMAWWPKNTADRATAVHLKDLSPQQALVANWLARKYRVAPEPLAALVAEAHVLSASSKLPAHLILAVMAIESGFHPYAQSHAGAQGLMQVMTGVHAQRYEAYGGRLAAFDPVTNLRVGAAVLSDAIKLRGGSVEQGLKFYLGGYALIEDGGYVAKVMAEKERLDAVAAGQRVQTD